MPGLPTGHEAIEQLVYTTVLADHDFAPGCVWKAHDMFLRIYFPAIKSKARLLELLCPLPTCPACVKALASFDMFVMLKFRHDMWSDEAQHVFAETLL